jgi:hypothetical protein
LAIQIAVDEAALMRVLDALADPDHQFQSLPRVQKTLFGIVPKITAANQLHCEKWLRSQAVICRAGFVYLRDGRMLLHL